MIINTHVHLGELKEIVARLGEDPQDLMSHASRHWWTAARWSMMSILQAQTALPYHLCILHHEGKLLGKPMAKPFKTPSSWAGWHCCEPLHHPTCLGTSLPTAASLWTAICNRRSGRVAHTSHNSNGHTPSAPSKECPNCTWYSTQPAEQTVMHVIPIAPNATRWDTGDQNALVASHSNQGMHLHLGHSRGIPDTHLGTTTTAMGGVTKQMP